MELLIVNFHYFREQVYSSGIYPISAKQFTSQLSEIGKNFEFISQFDLADCFANQKYPKGNYCLITFDDGLKEQIQAFNLLQELKIPAVYYIPVQPLVEKKVLDVHKLQLIRTKLSDEELLNQLKNRKNYCYTEDEATNAAMQYKYDNNIAREVKYQLNFKLSLQEKEVLLQKLFKQQFGDENAFAESFYMNQKELQLLASHKQIGAHGYAHVPLTTVSNANTDIKKSIDYLYNSTNQPIRSFSYPYGSKAAVNENVALLVKAHKVDFALTMWRGTNSITNQSNPYLLLRMDTNDAPGGKLYKYESN